MNIQVSAAELIAGVFALLGAIAGIIWAFAQVVLGMFKTHVSAQLESQNTLREQSDGNIERRIDALSNDFGRKHQENQTTFAGQIGGLEGRAKELEQNFFKLLADLPTKYVGREDWIRWTGIIDRKLDGLAAKFDQTRERRRNGDDSARD